MKTYFAIGFGVIVLAGGVFVVQKIFTPIQPAEGLPVVGENFKISEEKVEVNIEKEEALSAESAEAIAESAPVIEEKIPEKPKAPPVSQQNIPDRTTIIKNITIPWGIGFLPNGNMLITERDASLIDLNPETGELVSIPVDGVRVSGEGGLLGAAVHPQFSQNNWIYLYLTGTGSNGTMNTVIRYTYNGQALSEKKIIVENIPGARFHNGGRIAFGPDGYLYITTGDAENPPLSQDINSLAGKILRVSDSGAIPTDNPFGNAVYSYGNRNPQGLTWDTQGRLWSTEHGRSGSKSGFDEVNYIVKGGNYGWPDSEGNTVLPGTIAPALHSTPDVTWAPGSAAYWDGSVFFGGLRGSRLYEAVLSGTQVVELREYFVNELGRIRTVVLGPDGMLYITTSNRDGRGKVKSGDDKVIRLNPAQFR